MLQFNAEVDSRRANYPEGMSRFKKGDKVLINEGDFKGEWGVIVDKDLVGDEITVALGKNKREIRTHEAHVNKVEDK